MSKSNYYYLTLFFIILYENYCISAKPSSTKYTIYWNVPTFQCRSHKIDFTNLTETYGIKQNTGGDFRGEKITIFYDPGLFPAYLTSTQTRNGGLPQLGQWEMHMRQLQHDLTLAEEDVDNGVAIIDFERWRPLFHHNFGQLQLYRDESIAHVRQQHSYWPMALVRKEAQRQFENAARTFLLGSLQVAQRNTTRWRWGYYGYPHCYVNTQQDGWCHTSITKDNDSLMWLFDTVDVLLPTVYVTRQLNRTQYSQMIQARVRESYRIRNQSNKLRQKTILPYFWYKYTDTKQFIDEKTIRNIFTTLKSLPVDGLILWGSSEDVNTRKKCLQLYDHMEQILGPNVLQYFN